MRVNKQDTFLFFLLLLQLTSLLGFNGLILCVGFIMLYTFLHIKSIVSQKYSSKYLIDAICIIGLLNIVYCWVIYKQNITDGLIGIYYFGLFFSYYFFYNYFGKNYERIGKANSYILTMSVIVSIVAIAQAVFYPYINVFDFTMRNGRMRIWGTAMSFFAEIIGIAYLLNGKTNSKIKITVGVLIFALVFVSQSRGGIILLFVAVIIAFMKKSINSRSRNEIIKMFGLLIILVIGILALSKTKYWDQLFSFIDEIQEGTGSGATRLNEINYYFTQIKGKEFMGLGLLRGGSLLADKIFRTDLHYYIEDLGILGFILQTGVLGCIWILWIIISIVRKIIQLTKIENYEARHVCYVLVMLLVVTLVGITNTNYIAARTSILFFSMILAQTDVLIDREYCISKT